MSALTTHLQAVIRNEGPITVARYMAEALGHPQHGYYATRDPFGTAGDFTTAPEISQMFGELIGLWCAEMWQRIGRPRPVRLIEFGPGRGTLMADALRAAAQAMPDFRKALDLHLIETSPALRARQSGRLGDAGAHWHDSWDEVPEGPVLAVANEFLDALPVHQLVRHQGSWRERLVGADAAAAGFCFELSAGDSPAASFLPGALAASAGALPDGNIVEVRPAAVELARALGARIAGFGGAALVIDYGHGASSVGDTLQAVRQHRYADVLAEPGEADLTAHVDFAAFGEAARAAGAGVHGPVEQGRFLRLLGIETRAAALARHATPAQAEAIEQATRRLIDPMEMGRLFKVLALGRAALPPPPGFESTP
ncbi:MAG: class I SAM-dependent methyltransferase [Candidatus Eiseniibacteriota bacterium]